MLKVGETCGVCMVTISESTTTGARQGCMCEYAFTFAPALGISAEDLAVCMRKLTEPSFKSKMEMDRHGILSGLNTPQPQPQPIETAPKDKAILVYNDLWGWYSTKYFDGEWPYMEPRGKTHKDAQPGVWYPRPSLWLPLPPQLTTSNQTDE